MKIVYITANLPHGSDEAFVIPEIEQLHRSGHQVLVVPRSPKGPVLHGRDLLKNARIEPLYSRHVVKTAHAAMRAKPRKILAAVQPLFGSRSAAIALKNLAVVPKALWLADLALRWGAEHMHCHWAATTATAAMTASAVSGIPWSFTAHRWDIVENNLLATKARHASFVRFISEDGLKMARALGIAATSNARVVHMGVPIPEAILERSPNRHAKPVVLCPARLVEVKGHRFLLEAWRMLRRRGVDAELWLAGQGELRSHLESMTASLDLGDSVKFLGAINHQELLRIYESGSVSAVVLASLDLGHGHHEGIPVALIEAMSYAVPVVATATGGTPELVTSDSGLLVPPADAGALAEAVEALLHSHDLNRQLGLAGREHVAREYNIAGVTGQLVKEFVSAAQPAAALEGSKISLLGLRTFGGESQS